MPHSQKLEAVEQLLLRDRALEELDLLKTDITNGAAFFCHQHEALSVAAETTDDCRWRAVLFRALQKLQITMAAFWWAAVQYMPDLCVMPVVSISGTPLHELTGSQLHCETEECCFSEDDFDSDASDCDDPN